MPPLRPGLTLHWQQEACPPAVAVRLGVEPGLSPAIPPFLAPRCFEWADRFFRPSRASASIACIMRVSPPG